MTNLGHALVCDDHPLVAEALATTLSKFWPAARVTIAADFPSGWAAAATAPDLCLVDLDMPGAGPREGVAGFIAAAPSARVVVVTGSHDEALIGDLAAMGIAGCIAKTTKSEVIGAAIGLVLAGGLYLPHRLAVPARPLLSARQGEVAALLATGLSNKDIARSLGLAPETVKTYVSQLLAVLGAANRTDAAIKLREISAG